MLKFDSNNRHRVQYCPCGKSNHDGKFVPFEGYDLFGYCYSCAKTSFPEGRAKNSIPEKPSAPMVKGKGENFSTISSSVLEDSLANYSRNELFQFLVKLISEEEAKCVAFMYKLGTTKYWGGSTVFWQIDYNGAVRSGKIIQYKNRSDDSSFIGINCKRVKENIPPVKWVHKIPKDSHFILKQCFFGEHLLAENLTKPVAIVESEKTAIISAMYFPSLIWIASGSLGGLFKDRFEVLKGRKVILFPDMNGYEVWIKKTRELAKTVYPGSVTVSDFLQKHGTATDKSNGADLADLLIRLDPKRFQKK